MQQVISVGNQDFRSIRENNYFYIDKTSFIKEWWENGDSVTLITRPRRFGKTLSFPIQRKNSQNYLKILPFGKMKNLPTDHKLVYEISFPDRRRFSKR